MPVRRRLHVVDRDGNEFPWCRTSASWPFAWRGGSSCFALANISCASSSPIAASRAMSSSASAIAWFTTPSLSGQTVRLILRVRKRSAAALRSMSATALGRARAIVRRQLECCRPRFRAARAMPDRAQRCSWRHFRKQIERDAKGPLASPRASRQSALRMTSTSAPNWSPMLAQIAASRAATSAADPAL